MSTSDYTTIRSENEKRYGWDIGRIGKELLAERYDDRTHFIFELLQNAEDALRRRSAWVGRRTVSFELSHQELRIVHFGRPFDEADVRGICGIAESTHEGTDIGRFGIGFKSVYAVTDRPEVHSGSENFAIENYVLPARASMITRDGNETVILLPLRDSDETVHEEISVGLRKLGLRTLLFLREIDEIEWKIDDGRAGLYLRDKPEWLDTAVRRIALVGEQDGITASEESWFVFSREVATDEGKPAGYVEIAFQMFKSADSELEWIRPVSESPLVVFFPTIVETHLGFLVQGPYRTTPSRDNVPRTHAWNRYLVAETGTLLVESLRWLRDQQILNPDALACLPLDHTKFDEHKMFAPLFGAVREALRVEPLLPRFDGNYVSAHAARLARSHELRKLLDKVQLSALFGSAQELHWLSPDISQDQTPLLYSYLRGSWVCRRSRRSSSWKGSARRSSRASRTTGSCVSTLF